MNKKILVIILTFITVNTVFASEVVKRITYSNGETVLLCNKNGHIDYCTEEDRQISIGILNNPSIYVVDEKYLNKQQIANNAYNQSSYSKQSTIQTGADFVDSLTGVVRSVKKLVGELK